jgi:hypothetical protein
LHQTRVDARQLQKSIPHIYRGIDAKSQFPLPLTLSIAPTAEPNCSSKNLGWTPKVDEFVPNPMGVDFRSRHPDKTNLCDQTVPYFIFFFITLKPSVE